MQEAAGPDPLGQQRRQRKEEKLQLWTKAVDRATAPRLHARHLSLAQGETEEPPFYFCLTPGLPILVE